MNEIQEKMRQAIRFKEKTDKVVIESAKYNVAMTVGICDVRVTAYVGDDMDRHEYTMDWNEQTRQFVNVRRKSHGLFDDFKRQYNEMKISKMPTEMMFRLLQKANKRRKRDSKKWKKEARMYCGQFLRERDAQARTCANFRKYMDEVEAREGELRRREGEVRKWRDNVNELVKQENQQFRLLYSAQECSCCKEKRWRKKYRETYSGMSEFCGKYINIVDDMMRQKNLPDNVKARLCDMRVAFIESREFLDKVMKEETIKEAE